MSFLTVLEKTGEAIAHFFTSEEPVVQEIQTVATPFENAFLPGLSTLIQTGINAIANAEAAGVLAANTTGSNSVKLASVISSLATSLGPTLTALGVNTATVTTAQYTTFINSLVSAANAFETTQIAKAASTPAIPTFTNNNGLVTPAPVTGAAVPPK